MTRVIQRSTMEQQLQASIVQYLRSKLSSVTDPDALSVGIDVLVEAFNVPSTSDAADLLEVFSAHATKKQATTAATVPTSPLFLKFLDSLKAKGFFDGVAEGSPEYAERYAKVVAKFEERLSSEKKGASAASPSSSAAASAPAPAVDADEAGAEAAKEEGNKHVAAQRYAQAVECYSEALEKAPSGKNVHIYYSNRAAARTHLKDLEGAVDDARSAIAAQPTYTKAHIRLATALQMLGRFSAAEDAWREVQRLDPSSTAATEAIAVCQSKLRSTDDDDYDADSAVGSAPGVGGGFPGMPGGFPGMPGGFPGMGGGGGGMPDMSELLR